MSQTLTKAGQAQVETTTAPQLAQVTSSAANLRDSQQQERRGEEITYDKAKSDKLVEIITATGGKEYDVSVKYGDVDPKTGVGPVRMLEELINASGIKTVKVTGVYREGLAKSVTEVQREADTRMTREGKEAGGQTYAALTIRALENGKLHFTDPSLESKWEQALPLLKVLVNPQAGELINSRLANPITNGFEPATAPESRIRATQEILKSTGYYSGEVDGIIGKDYRAGLAAFIEAKTGQKFDGVGGSNTVRALLEAYLK